MRVLLWTEFFWPHIGGGEIQSAAFALAMKKRGYEFAVITSHGDAVRPDEDDYQGIPIFRFRFREALAGRKVEMFVDTRKQISALKRRFRAELVHIYFTDPSVLFHLQTVDAYPAPMLLSLHVGLPARVAKESSLLQRALTAAQWVTTTSQAMLNQARQLVPEIIPYSSFIYNGLERPYMTLTPQPKETQQIVCVGRLVEDKGFDLALRAFAELSEQFPSALMIIAGDGAARQSLERLARGLGISQRVIFQGWVKHEDIPALINQASLVVMPSRWEEAFGLVALEAALMEKPVVAARVGGLPEVVTDGTTGMLVDKENSEALASAIGYLLRNPAEAARMGQAARQRAQTLFSLDRHVGAYEALYRKLVESHLSSPPDLSRS